jgi:hypothetical protein
VDATQQPDDDDHADAHRHDPDDNLAALDFFSPRAADPPDDVTGTLFDAHAAPTPAGDEHEHAAPTSDGDEHATPEDELPTPIFTVTNPPGTVTVTTFLDGRIDRVELSAGASSMTESELAQEIVVIAELATAKAKSAQYAFMLEGMVGEGHDRATTHDFLARDLKLPSPQQAAAAQAAVFATRYVGDDD